MGSTPEPTLQDVMTKLSFIIDTTRVNGDKLDKYISATDANIESIRSNVNCNNSKIEAVSSSVEVNSSAIQSIEERVLQLEKLNTEIQSNVTTIEVNKQQQLSNNITIHGIPFKKDEITTNIAVSICKSLNVPIAPTDITKSYRTKGTRSSPGLIVVKFVKFDTKNNILKAKRNRPDLKLCEIDPGFDGDSAIFINNHLTPYFARLMYLCKKLISPESMHSCWISSVGISVKLVDDKIHSVKSRHDIDEIVSALNLGRTSVFTDANSDQQCPSNNNPHNSNSNKRNRNHIDSSDDANKTKKPKQITQRRPTTRSNATKTSTS